MALTMMGDDEVTVLDPNHPVMIGNYKSRAIPCPGQDATSELVGYATASFATNMPTYYPTELYAPLTTAIALTYMLTVTGL
jgi:hypothetical protein